MLLIQKGHSALCCWTASAASAGGMSWCSNTGKAMNRDFETIRKPRAIQTGRCLFRLVWKGLLLCKCHAWCSQKSVSTEIMRASRLPADTSKSSSFFLNSKENFKYIYTSPHLGSISYIYNLKASKLSHWAEIKLSCWDADVQLPCLFSCIQTDSVSTVSIYYLILDWCEWIIAKD